MVFSGVIQPEYENIVKSMNLEAELGPRRKLTLNEYERIHESKLGPDESMLNPKHEFILVDVNTTTESKGERRYVFNE